ncbi:halocyanin domain-containing protein [Haladaptatus caseinilyticus]|uniref:halocyanin domain-containing protein n=1 Tax=Haladaptatus caseinilyticus TaxID=2993314 RepID=UPI00224A7430|nr:halocyanin domain-containing protein [Haladaptatus caseinilyticus]
MAPKPSENPTNDKQTTGTSRRRILTLGASLGVTTLAGCLGSGTDSSDTTENTDGSAVDSWMSDALNYDGVVDKTGSDRVVVAVGAGGDTGPYAFDPAAIRVSPGTTVVWEWTGKGGAHNVVEENGAFASDLLSNKNATFKHTVEESKTYQYVCEPHRSMGMKGALVVE